MHVLQLWGYKPVNTPLQVLYGTRAHAPCICIIVQLGHMLSTTFTYKYEASAHEQKYMRNAQWARSMGVATMAN